MVSSRHRDNRFLTPSQPRKSYQGDSRNESYNSISRKFEYSARNSYIPLADSCYVAFVKVLLNYGEQIFVWIVVPNVFVGSPRMRNRGIRDATVIGKLEHSHPKPYF